jgi:diguanylate cyclase
MTTLSTTSSPAAIARTAIRQLATARVAPTPENFARAYRLAAGGDGGVAAAVDPEEVLSQLAHAIATRRPNLGSALRLHENVLHRAWSKALNAVDEMVSEALTDPSREWPRVLQRLLTQLDASHADWTRARKLAAVRHVLLAPTADERTREKLERLMAAWAAGPQRHAGPQVSGPPATAAAGSDGVPPAFAVEAVAASSAPGGQAASVTAWRSLALAALGLVAPGSRHPTNAASANGPHTLAARLESLAGVPGAEWLDEIKAACAQTHAEARRQQALRDRLVKLLRLVCQNLALFADDGAWVSGQVARVTELLDAPLDECALTEAEESLQRAVRRQSELSADLKAAKAAVREMLDSIIDRLGVAANSTGELHDRITERAVAIKQADDLPSLARVVANLLNDTVEMREGMMRTHSELSAARESAQQYEARAQELERELVDVSGLVRIDPLTQVLNRRGLEEAFAIAQARAERDRTPLSVALLDIDNFKNVNDTFGHHAGDMALKHVSSMVRGALRPTDTVARFGGEEFVILLPATSTADAVNVLARAQRQLTRAYFLHDNEKILITFSAGVTDYRHGDSHESAIKRADTAVYVAKAAGKNRVQVG